ncbi:hypothetical protein [Nitrosophilus labii]|uniref:hypothetical protein n=1 Tax=Nitrosophilus labii TaxID=2706014 RepID=UPI001656FDBF|nr:hypothetical protein [Nitrosophilus labii]
MNSFAIWLENQDTSIDECHLNIWYDKENKYKNYIEFGFKYDATLINNIKLYVPFRVEQSMVEDIVETRLRNDEKLLGALFNTTIESLNNNLVKMNHYLHPEFYLSGVQFSIDDVENGGSLIDLFPEDIEGHSKSYIRFRIYRIDKLVKLIDENLSYFEGIFRKSGIFELNINNIRKMPEQIALEMGEHSHSFKRIHVFLMFNNSVDIYFENFGLKDARILENHIWDDYIKFDNVNNYYALDKKTDIEKVIAYHWFKGNKVGKVEKNISDFNLFVKIKYINFNLRALIITCIVIILLGALGSILADWINLERFIIGVIIGITIWLDKINQRI